MHKNSYKRMHEMRLRYVKAGQSVLDVGGADVNGSYRPIFKDCTYVTLDWERADIIVKGYDWPVDDDSFDVVVSGQTLEHDKFFWLTLKNIARVLKPGGIFLLIVPGDWPYHAYPVDCWRFQLDSVQAIAEWAGLQALWKVQDVGCREKARCRSDLCSAYRKPPATS